MVWTISYSDSALKELRKLDRQHAKRILDYMDERIATLEDPRCTGKVLTGTLESLWRYRVGEYRIICDIQDKVLRVLIVKIGNRKNVYN